ASCTRTSAQSLIATDGAVADLNGASACLVNAPTLSRTDARDAVRGVAGHGAINEAQAVPASGAENSSATRECTRRTIRNTDRPIAGRHHAGQGQVAEPGVADPAPLGGPAVGDGEPRDAHRDRGARISAADHVEDSRRVVAADRELTGPRAIDRQV